MTFNDLRRSLILLQQHDRLTNYILIHDYNHDEFRHFPTVRLWRPFYTSTFCISMFNLQWFNTTVGLYYGSIVDSNHRFRLKHLLKEIWPLWDKLTHRHKTTSHYSSVMHSTKQITKTVEISLPTLLFALVFWNGDPLIFLLISNPDTLI